MLKLDVIFWICIFTVLFFSMETKAETRLVVNLASSHLHGPDFELEDKGITKYNEDNYGLGVEYHPSGSALYYGAGFYENSFFEESRYVTIGAKARSNSNVYVSAELSVADGYELSPESHGDYLIAPGVALNTRFGPDDRHATKMLFMIGGVFGLQYNYRFGE